MAQLSKFAVDGGEEEVAMRRTVVFILNWLLSLLGEHGEPTLEGAWRTGTETPIQLPEAESGRGAGGWDGGNRVDPALDPEEAFRRDVAAGAAQIFAPRNCDESSVQFAEIENDGSFRTDGEISEREHNTMRFTRVERKVLTCSSAVVSVTCL